jgi:hypothetical protein
VLDENENSFRTGRVNGKVFVGFHVNQDLDALKKQKKSYKRPSLLNNDVVWASKSTLRYPVLVKSIIAWHGQACTQIFENSAQVLSR